MIANDNSLEVSKPTPFDRLSDARHGDVFVHKDGSRWQVIGFYQNPTVILARVGAEQPAPLDRPQLTIDPTSLWADEWESNWKDFT